MKGTVGGVSLGSVKEHLFHVGGSCKHSMNTGQD